MSEVKKEKKEKKVTKKKTVTEAKKETKVKASKTKDNKGLLTKKEQKHYHVFSKIVKILAKIARIFLMVLVPFIVLAMILIPMMFNKFEITANVIKFNNASIIVRDDGLSFKIGDKIHVIDCDISEVDNIMTFLINHSKTTIIFMLELSLLLLVITAIFEIYLFSYLEKLFGNFEKDKTPFTKENTDILLIIVKYLVIIKICSICMVIVGLFNNSLTSFSIFELLTLYVTYLIFKYATNMQKKLDTTLSD